MNDVRTTAQRVTALEARKELCGKSNVALSNWTFPLEGRTNKRRDNSQSLE
jgi:hypothetical protein